MAYTPRTLADGRVMIVGIGTPSLSGERASSLRRVTEHWRPLIVKHARRTGVSPAWIAAILWVESRGEPLAKSPAGAVGLMQLMPLWWHGHSEAEMKDPDRSVQYGADLIAAIRRTQPSLPTVASVYNCGSSTATNAPRPGSGPWGMCEQAGYISAVVSANNYAIQKALLPRMRAPRSVGERLADVAQRHTLGALFGLGLVVYLLGSGGR